MIIITPVFACLAIACALIFFGRSLKLTRLISFVGSVIILFLGGIVLYTILLQGPSTLSFGDWPRPYAISFRVDLLSAFLIFISSLLGLCGSIASLSSLSAKAELRGYHIFYFFMMAGVMGAFSTGDLFNLYVWFELLLIGSFLLIVSVKSKALYAGLYKYVILSVLSSFFFLIGIALIYASSGTLDLLELKKVALEQNVSQLFTMGLFFLTTAFLIKAGAFPFYFWLPAIYPKTFTASAAVFSGLLTKVGVYALIRVLGPFMGSINAEFKIFIYVCAVSSMVLGVLGAFSKDDIKAILSFHIISQVGYIVLAFSLGTEFGLAAAIFYFVHHMVVKANLFLSAAYIEERGEGTRVSLLGGLYEKEFLFSILFAVSALSLVGIPPLSGFWAKVLTIQSLLKVEDWVGLAACLGVGMFTLMSMLKIWLGAFYKPSAEKAPGAKANPRRKWILIPIATLSLWTIAMGVGQRYTWPLAKEMARQLSNQGETP